MDSITAVNRKQEYVLTEFHRGTSSDWIYQLAPLVMEKMFPSTNPIFTVVSPLVVLMEDQIREATQARTRDKG